MFGDRFGLTAIAATRPTDHIDVQRGAAFHHASETVLKVVGCLAHSYEYGGFVAGGAVTIDTTDFIECGEDIMVGNDTASPGGYWNYAYLNAAWVLSSELNLSVTACNFYGKGSLTSPTSISTGISFFRNTDDSESKNVSVSGCKFESINRAFNGVDLNLYAHSIVNPSVQYDSLKIINNLFNDMETAVFYSTTSLTNAATVVSRSWVIEKLIYSNNVHDQCGHNITSQDRGLLEFTAQTVIVDSNTFTDCHLSGGTAADPNRIIHFDGGFKSGVITNNKFIDCYNFLGTVNTIEIGITANYQNNIINNNTIETDPDLAGLVTTAVQNGIKFVPYMTTINTSLIYVKLELKGNKFEPYNPNFVVLASQDSAAPVIGVSDLAEQWEWGGVEVEGNHFRASVSNIGGFSDYSNNAQYPIQISGGGLPTLDIVQNFLGASSANIFGANQFVALLDLRRCNPVQLVGASTAVSVSNNRFEIDTPGWNHFSDDYDAQSIIGCRITKWPDTISVTDNTFIGAPLILRYIYNSPRDGADISGNFSKRVINITGNVFESLTQYNIKTLVDVVPATGFEGKGDLAATSPELTNRYVKLLFSDNQINGAEDSLDGAAYTEQSSVVRFWHLDSATIVNAATLANPALPTDEYYDEFDVTVVTGANRGLASSGLMYDWQVQNNKLINSFFYLDSQGTGLCLGVMTQFEQVNAAPTQWQNFNLAAATGNIT